MGMLPSTYPPWQLAYYYYRKWAFVGEFDLILSELQESVRMKRGQNREASVGIY
jgi:hypothetical protein